MDVAESVVCSHCNTRVYRHWLVDHVQQELLDETTCRPCADVVQTLTDLLCALHLYGHLKTPVINITCSRCCFKAGSVETFVEHLQARCEEDMQSCEGAAPGKNTAAPVSGDKKSSFTYRVSYQPDSVEEGKGEGGSCEKTVGTSSMGEWDGQQFQQMMSTLLTDTSGKGRQKTSPEEDIGGRNKVTIDMASVCEDEEDDTVSEDVMNYVEPKSFSSQSLEEKNTANQDNDTDTKASKECSEPSNKMKTKTTRVRRSRAKKQQLENLLKCHMCGYSDQKKDGLESHMLETHGKVEYRCNNCTFMAKSLRNLRRHQLGHQRMHECKYCQFTTRWQKNLILHERRHTAQQTFLCDVCGKDFTSKSSYKRHHCRHSHTVPPLPTCVCLICSKTFHGKTALQHHTDFSHRDKTLQCDQCKKTYKSYSGYMSHMSVHSQDEQECKDCGTKFLTKSALYRHRGKTHVTPKQKCDTCGKLFHHRSHMEEHKKTHMGDEAKMYKCPTCPASFKWPKSLKKHQTTHEGRKTCNICNKDYSGPRQLKRHMSTAHKEQSSK